MTVDVLGSNRNEKEIRSMKQLGLMLVLAIGFVAGCKSTPSTSTQPAIAEPPKADAPVAPTIPQAALLVPDKPVYDFGMIEPGSQVEGSFVLTNSGKTTVEIDKNIKTSCGCTVPSLTTYTLEPGQNTALNVKFHAGTHPGKTSKKITVNTLEPRKEKLELTIEATIRKHIDVKPDVCRFELKDNSEKNRQSIILESTDNTPFHVTGFNCRNDAIKVQFDAQAHHTRYELPVEVDMEKLAKSPTGVINVTTDHPKAGTVTIRFETTLPFSAMPASVFFRQIAQDQPNISTVSIVSNFNEPFEIDQIRSEKGLVEVQSKTQKSPTTWEITVLVTVPKEGETRVIHDQLLVDIKGQPSPALTIPVYARMPRAAEKPNKPGEK